jgi:uncharacterized protein (TIGR04222 family)
MEILLNNRLANMYGPHFLLFYAVTILMTIITLAIVKRLLDRTDKLPSPAIPTKVDPYQIAYLRGGTNEMARSVVFSLMQKDLLEFVQNTNETSIKRKNSTNPLPKLNNIEDITLDWFSSTREIKELFGSNGLILQLEAFGDSYKQTLERQQLLTDSELKGSFAIFKWLGILLIANLGLYKIVAALANGRFNVIFLLIMGGVGLGLIAWASVMPRTTKLGKAYLERLQIAFENLKAKSQYMYRQPETAQQASQTTFAGVDPLLLTVGVFGGGILAGTMYDNYNQAFQKSQQANAASYSSCGSSCGSCSSSDGGSSCSGGSSCGGGCGGGCGG